MVEINGELVGYGRALWWEELDGLRRYGSAGFVVPEARRMGIGRAILAWLEDVHRQYAASHPPACEKEHVVWGELASEGLVALVTEAGYDPIRHFFEMVRPTLDDIEMFPLPDGVEVRPVTPDQYRAIWDADVGSVSRPLGLQRADRNGVPGVAERQDDLPARACGRSPGTSRRTK